MAASSGSWPRWQRHSSITADQTITAKEDPIRAEVYRSPPWPSGYPPAFHCLSKCERADVAAGPLQVTDGLLRLTWSLTPHSPAAALTDRRWRLHTSRRIAQHLRACPLCTVSLGDRRPVRQWAGLTPKPHHAQQQRVALRGSFRLRLASTCNHRPAEVRLESMAR
jgi:hypothetical protein